MECGLKRMRVFDASDLTLELELMFEFKESDVAAAVELELRLTKEAIGDGCAGDGVNSDDFINT